jgi:hypothetical protein
VRNFPDFIEAYCTYAKDAYCPPQFHLWTGISTVAGALERKVWQDRGKYHLHPNLYVLLVAHPAIGKSTAGNVGNDFLRCLGGEENKIKFLATQNNPASFVKQFVPHKVFYVGDQQHTHSSYYFYASEGSNALGESSGKQGKILPSLTDFYDCPPAWNKRLVNEDIPLFNVCCNMLACVTFSFLRELLPDRESDGGFASRIIFVVQDDVFARSPKWKEPAPPAIKGKLLEDLSDIYSMTGEFVISQEVQRRFEEWFPEQDTHRQALASAKMQAFLGRKHTNVAKLAMICSASESSSMIIELRHWERAMTLIEETEKKLPKIVKNTTDKATPKGLNYNIMRILKEDGGGSAMMSREKLFSALISFGADSSRLDQTMLTLHRSGLVATEHGGEGKQRFRLIGNPDDYL